MCGRFSQVVHTTDLAQQLGGSGTLADALDIPANYNVAPTQMATVITSIGPERLEAMMWGLVPHWASDRTGAASLINARSESIATRPSFRIPIRQKRCLVPADSFYEWATVGKQKQPYRILPRHEGAYLFMAGIWDEWSASDGQVWRTFSIITTEPNKEMQDIHNRMPALLQTQEERLLWLSDGKVEDTLALLRPLPNNLLKTYRVNAYVNSVSSNGAQLHEAAKEEQLRLF